MAQEYFISCSVKRKYWTTVAESIAAILQTQLLQYLHSYESDISSSVDVQVSLSIPAFLSTISRWLSAISFGQVNENWTEPMQGYQFFEVSKTPFSIEADHWQKLSTHHCAHIRTTERNFWIQGPVPDRCLAQLNLFPGGNSRHKHAVGLWRSNNSVFPDVNPTSNHALCKDWPQKLNYNWPFCSLTSCCFFSAATSISFMLLSQAYILQNLNRQVFALPTRFWFLVTQFPSNASVSLEP